jgi:hypothetical protein
LDIQKLDREEINECYKAMDAELAALQIKQTMIEIPRSEVPPGKQVIKSTWAF